MGETEKYNCEWKNLVHRKYTHIILGGKIPKSLSSLEMLQFEISSMWAPYPHMC